MSINRLRFKILVLAAVLAAQAGCSKTVDATPAENGVNGAARVQPATPDATTIDAELTKLAGQDGAKAATYLQSLGFTPEVATALSRDFPVKVTTATRIEANLDQDPEMESVIEISIQGNTEDEPGLTAKTNLLAWLDPANGRFNPVGFRTFGSDSCIMDGRFEFRAAKIRDTTVSDIIADWAEAPTCNGDFNQTAGTDIIALKDGKLVNLLEYSDDNEIDRVEGTTIDPLIRVRLSDSIPARAVWKQEENGEVMYTKAFNLATNRFELVPELTPEDSRLDATAKARALGNSCFKHIKSGHFSWALGACGKAIESPSMADTGFAGSSYYNMGLIAQRTGDRESAMEWFRKSLEARPDNRIVETALAELEKR